MTTRMRIARARVAVRAAAVRQAVTDTRTRDHAWIREHGTDLPEVADWTWTG